jgi:hypothetical protein
VHVVEGDEQLLLAGEGTSSLDKTDSDSKVDEKKEVAEVIDEKELKLTETRDVVALSLDT